MRSLNPPRAALAAAGLLFAPALAPLAAALLVPALLAPGPARAQQGQGPGWFVPPGAGAGGGQAQPAPRPAAPRPQPQTRPTPAVPAMPAPGPGAEAGEPEVQIQLPPVPDLPALPRGAAPPASVIGVLGVPDIMRVSTAAQQVERTIGERRDKLNQDAQKEQVAWREMQQALANQRSGLNAEQVRAKERELQERITNAQRQFRDRNRIIQEAAQYGLAQIERTLIAVIRQVAESRGMNLVLHRQQVALNINEFDITEQVAEQMNKILPSVNVPPDGVSPVAALQQSQGQQSQGQPPQAQPAGQGQAPAAQGAPQGAQTASGGGASGAGQGGAAPATQPAAPAVQPAAPRR